MLKHRTPARPTSDAPAGRRRAAAARGRLRGAADALRRRASRFAADERGAAVTVVVVFALGLAMALGLVVDAGRAYSERARLQAWLDSLAVAAAAQLDGRPDAIERAEWVIANAGIVQQGVHSTDPNAPDGADDVGFEVARTLWLREAPPEGLGGLSEAEILALSTTEGRDARFALLEAEPRRVSFTGLSLAHAASAGGPGPSSFSIGARSVAMPVPGYVCGVPVIAACLPPEEPETMETPGVQLRLRKNLDGVWEPGEYGVVTDIPDRPDGACDAYTGAERLACQLAVEPPEGLCPTTVDLRAGDGIEVGGALNTRFDIFTDAVSHLRGHPAAPSDINTISGNLFTCEGAQYDTVSDSMALPGDPCFHTGACDFASPVIRGEDLDLYWRENHGGSMPFDAATRYEVYLYEVLEGWLNPEGPEDSSNPQCNPNAEPQVDRRLVNIALIDCEGLEGLTHERVQVRGHVQGLLTEPALDTTNAIITFDGVHQNEFMAAGDVVRQAFSAEAEIGCADDGLGCMREIVLDRDHHGAGSDNGSFDDYRVTDMPIGPNASFRVVGLRDDGERVRLDRFTFERRGDLPGAPAGSGGTWQRIEAEDMTRDGFRETRGNRASGGKMVYVNGSEGTLEGALTVRPGLYDVVVRAQDETDGQSTVRLFIVSETPQSADPWPSADRRVIDEHGRTTYDPYRDLGLMRIEVKQSEKANKDAWRNVPMLFDTANITGGDTDLASTQFGNVLIVSEDGDETDPDDAAEGGWILFHFDRPTRIHSLTVFDTEAGGVIRVYDHVQTDPEGEFRTRSDGTLQAMRTGVRHDRREMAHFAVPRLGDGRHVKMRIGTENVRTLAYFIPDSGAIDNLEFSNDLTVPVRDDTVMLEVVRLVGGAVGFWSVVWE